MIKPEDIIAHIDTIKSSVEETKSQLQSLQATSEAGAGLVKAIVNGHKQVVSIAIDESLLLPEDKVMLQDLIVAAVNLALGKVEEKIKTEIKQLSPFSDMLNSLIK